MPPNRPLSFGFDKVRNGDYQGVGRASASPLPAMGAHMGDALCGEPPTPKDSFKKDSSIWFEDGNIVVVAQDTAFRFHKSVLSLHSSVFRDLFSIPQPPLAGGEADETLDGCPVVRVSDTAYEFRELLRVIYYGGVSHLHPDRDVEFPVLAALARLSHKYQLDQLLAAAIHRLKGTFTTQLDVWDRCGGLSPLDSIEAANLFRLLDRPEMMPVAIYGCCQMSSSALLQGTTRADDVTREHLSPSDLELCFEVKEKLLQATARLLAQMCEACDARILQAPSDPDVSDPCCSSPEDCSAGLRALLRNFRENLRDCVFPDRLDTYYGAMLECVPYNRQICRACEDVLQEAYIQLRRKIWASLPWLMDVEVDEWNSA